MREGAIRSAPSVIHDVCSRCSFLLPRAGGAVDACRTPARKAFQAICAPLHDSLSSTMTVQGVQVPQLASDNLAGTNCPTELREYTMGDNLPNSTHQMPARSPDAGRHSPPGTPEAAPTPATGELSSGAEVRRGVALHRALARTGRHLWKELALCRWPHLCLPACSLCASRPRAGWRLRQPRGRCAAAGRSGGGGDR